MVTTVAVSLARLIISLEFESGSSILVSEIMDSISAEKFSKAWSECRMVLSGVVQWLDFTVSPFLLSLFFVGALVFENLCASLTEMACAVAAEVGEEEVPMTMLKIIGLEISRCLLPFLFADLVSQASPRLASI